MALGFWAIGAPLGAFGVLFARTAAERGTVLALAAMLLAVGALIAKTGR